MAFSYLFIENNLIHFFVCEKKLDDEVRILIFCEYPVLFQIKEHLTGVSIHKYEEFLPWLTEFRKNNASQKIFVPSETNFAIGSILTDPSESGTSPIQSMKAVKNTTEMQNMRESNVFLLFERCKKCLAGSRQCSSGGIPLLDGARTEGGKELYGTGDG